MSAGKGDTPRPLSITRDSFGDRWERTFKRCPKCRGEGIFGEDKRGRPAACGECGGNGRAKEAA